MKKTDTPSLTDKKQNKRGIALSILFFVILAILWWAALWLVLPVEWLQGTLPSLVLVHVAPPFLTVAAWWMGKQLWAWHGTRIRKRADKAATAEKEARIAAEKTEYQKSMDRRRAHVECRAVWAELASIPNKPEAGAGQCVLLEQSLETLQGAGRETVLVSSLKRVFKTAFRQCEALMWLPVVVFAEDLTRKDWVEQAWHQTVAESDAEHLPQSFDCITLLDSLEVVSRVVALFDNDPTLPAVIVVGMDSPLADAAAEESYETGAQGSKPGHAVAAMLLNRVGLEAPDDVETSSSGRKEDDPYTPFWERKQGNKAASPWERIPPALREDFWSFSPFATLHKSNTASDLKSKRDSVLSQKIHDAIKEALINAGLRDLPLKEEKDEEDATAKAEKAPTIKAEDAEPLELGWLVHDAVSLRLVALCSAIRDCGIELPDIPVSLKKKHGDTGTAHSVLMLVEALIRVEQRQKSVLIAGFNENGSTSIGLVRPIF